MVAGAGNDPAWSAYEAGPDPTPGNPQDDIAVIGWMDDGSFVIDCPHDMVGNRLAESRLVSGWFSGRHIFHVESSGIAGMGDVCASDRRDGSGGDDDPGLSGLMASGVGFDPTTCRVEAGRSSG